MLEKETPYDPMPPLLLDVKTLYSKIVFLFSDFQPFTDSLRTKEYLQSCLGEHQENCKFLKF